MKKRLLALFLVVGVIFTMTGCNKAGSDKATQSQVTSEESVTQAQATKEDPVKLTVEVFDRGNMPEAYGTSTDNRWTKWIQEQALSELNLDVEFAAVARTDETTKLMALMAANQAPDVMFTYSTDIFYQFASEGAVADLTESIEKYGANITANIGDECMKFGNLDGSQYAVMARRNLIDVQCFFIRKDWLDKVGLSVTKRNGIDSMTPTELEAALKAFKSAGLSDYPFGIEVSDANQAFVEPITGAFVNLSEIDNKITSTQPFFNFSGSKEGFRYINGLYNEGLLNPDFALWSASDLGEQIASGKVGAWGATSWQYMAANQELAALYSADSNANVIPIDLCHEDGSASLNYVYSAIGLYNMVPTANNKADAAVKYLNWLADPVNDKVLRYGIEGEHYKLDSDGVPVAIDKAHNEETMISTTDLTLMYNDDPDTKIGALSGIKNSFPETFWQLRSDAMKIALSVNTYVREKDIYLGAPIPSSAEYKASMKEDSIKLFTNSIIAAPGTFDSTWDGDLKKYLDNGGQTVISDKEAAYDAIS